MSDDPVKALRGTFQLDSATRVYIWQGLSKSHHVEQLPPVILQGVAPLDCAMDPSHQYSSPADGQERGRRDEERRSPPSQKSSDERVFRTPKQSHERRSHPYDLPQSTAGNGRAHSSTPPSTPRPSPPPARASKAKRPAGRKPRLGAVPKTRNVECVVEPGAAGDQGVTGKIRSVYGVDIKFYTLRGEGPLLAVPRHVDAGNDDDVFTYNYVDHPDHATWVSKGGEWVKAQAGYSATMLKDDDGFPMLLRLYETPARARASPMAGWVKYTTLKRYQF
ncbi:hypothetical protein AURDEDRAFT_114084, partial [Auricularia subglabra TFB-10046 SS5]